MAIQNRRGVYTDFDATKMVAGEYAVVQSGDPNNTNGTAVYICFQNGSAKRLILVEDLDAVVGSLGDLETTAKTTVVDAINELAERESILFGTSSTGGSTRDKVVTCADFEAVDGALIAITVSQDNTVTDARFNVNGTGAKSIYSNHEASTDTSWLTKGTYLFVYNSINGGRFTLIGATERIASDTAPLMDGTAAVGTSKKYARADHVHPSDTSRATVAALNETNAQVTQLKEDLNAKADTVDMLKAFPTDTASGSVASFADGANVPVKSLIVNIDPVQSGSGDPSPDNVRPISGHTQAVVTRTGVNVWDEESEDGYYDISNNGVKVSSSSWKRFKNLITCIPEANYYFMAAYTGSDSFGALIFYDANKNMIRYQTSVIKNSVFATPQNCRYIGFYAKPAWFAANISINSISTDHDYHPYSGQSITIPLGQTVYGGTLDVTNGVLTTYPYYASYNGETLTGAWISDRDKYVSGTTPTTGAQVVNIGGAGTDVQLTPHEVRSLLGSNNVWADTGDAEVTYRADPTLYIQRKIAEALS